MTAHEIKLYFAYTSPYSYLAMQPAYDLERSHNVRVRFIPYGVNIRKVYGPLDRADADRRKVRYLYIDARRIAKERGLVIYPPKKIFSARLAFYGGLYAVFGLGAAVGAVSVGTVFVGASRMLLIRSGLLGMAVFLAVFGLIRQIWVAYPVVLVVGFAYFVTVTSLSTALQAHIADEVRGRVMALWIMGFGGTVPL